MSRFYDTDGINKKLCALELKHNIWLQRELQPLRHQLEVTAAPRKLKALALAYAKLTAHDGRKHNLSIGQRNVIKEFRKCKRQ